MNTLETYLDVLRRVKQVCPEAVIGGGVLRDLACGVQPNDLDIFVSVEGRGGRDIKPALEAALGLSTWHVDPSAAFYFADRPDLYGVINFTGRMYPLPLQVVVMRGDDFAISETFARAVAERFDFGICQIVHDGAGYTTTDAWQDDFNHKTFTVCSCDSEDDLERSTKRFERISARYPGWQMVVPEDIKDGFIPY